MKVGDNIPVTIAGQVVANAEVREMGDGTATLIVPATRVVMAVRTELAYEAPAPVEPDTEHIITGVDRQGEAETVGNDTPTPPPAEPTQVEAPAPVAVSGETTPEGHNPEGDAAQNNASPAQVEAAKEVSGE